MWKLPWHRLRSLERTEIPNNKLCQIPTVLYCCYHCLKAQITDNTERNDNYATTAHAIRNGGMSNETLPKHLFPFNASNSLVNDVFRLLLCKRKLFRVVNFFLSVEAKLSSRKMKKIKKTGSDQIRTP